MKTPLNEKSVEQMVRARLCTIIQKTGRFTWGAVFVGVAISIVAGLITSMTLLSIGGLISGIGFGGCMALDLILFQYMTGGVFEPDQSEPNEK